MKIIGENKCYEIFSPVDGINYQCDISTPDEIEDYEYKYSQFANKDIGILSGLFGYCRTGDAASLDVAGSPYWGVDVSSPGRTALIFSPNFSYEIDGGKFAVLSGLQDGDNVTVDFVFAPRLPEEWGGNWPLVKNKRFYRCTPEYEDTTDHRMRVRHNAEIQEANEIGIIINHGLITGVLCEFYLRVYPI